MNGHLDILLFAVDSYIYLSIATVVKTENPQR